VAEAELFLNEDIGQVLALAGDDEDALEQVPDEILAFAATLRAAPALRAALADVTVPVDAKRGVIQSLLEGKAHRLTTQLVDEVVAEGLAARPLIRSLEDLGLAAYLARAERRGTLPSVEDELFRFSRILSGSNELVAALTDLALPLA
jgi:F-type H+-transporting ATPase subunit delta